MATVTLKVIRHQDGEAYESYRNLLVDGFNADIIIGESDIAQLIIQGYVYDEGVNVEAVHMQTDDLYTADIACVKGVDFYSPHGETAGGKVRMMVSESYAYVGLYNNWFKIIDDVPHSIEFRFDSSEIWSCRIYQHEETGKLLLVFLVI